MEDRDLSKLEKILDKLYWGAYAFGVGLDLVASHHFNLAGVDENPIYRWVGENYGQDLASQVGILLYAGLAIGIYGVYRLAKSLDKENKFHPLAIKACIIYPFLVGMAVKHLDASLENIRIFSSL